MPLRARIRRASAAQERHAGWAELSQGRGNLKLRPDGLGANVVLSHYHPAVIAGFLDDPGKHCRDPTDLERHPSEQILDELQTFVAAPAVGDRHRSR